MARQSKKRPHWSKSKGWRTHGVGCYDHEWASFQECARLTGVTTNAWIRGWLREAVGYEKLQIAGRENLRVQEPEGLPGETDVEG